MCSKSEMEKCHTSEYVSIKCNVKEVSMEKLTRENVGRANAENFIAIKTNGFCERLIANFMVFINSTPHGQSIRGIFRSFKLNIRMMFLSVVFPCQLLSYNESDVNKLYTTIKKQKLRIRIQKG